MSFLAFEVNLEYVFRHLVPLTETCSRYYTWLNIWLRLVCTHRSLWQNTNRIEQILYAHISWGTISDTRQDVFLWEETWREGQQILPEPLNSNKSFNSSFYFCSCPLEWKARYSSSHRASVGFCPLSFSVRDLVIQGSVSQAQLYGLPSQIACANMLGSVLICRVIQKSSTILQGGPRKSSPSQGQKHAIEDGQRGGVGRNTDSTTVD
jgi:hypothetical protein